LAGFFRPARGHASRSIVVGSPQKSQKLWEKIESNQWTSSADLSGSQVVLLAHPHARTDRRAEATIERCYVTA
jgi:hypothetical protein